MLEKINFNMDRRVPTLVTFIDFKKAFDCVQFDILIKKVEALDLDEKFISWLKDYLSKRQQRVFANGHLSSFLDIRQGVPQGSILGPLLYIIYANDIHNILTKCGFAFYADDTVLYSTHSNFTVAKKSMQCNLRKLNSWCSTNGIFMNLKKTKYMIFGSNCTLAKVKEFDLKVDGVQIERVYSYTYLGLTLDPSLTFDKHVRKLIGRVSDKIKQLQKMRYFLNIEAATLVYKNMILPILEYGNIFLSAATKINRDRLQTLQNRGLRIACNANKGTDKDVLHETCKLQRLKVRRDLHLLSFMYTLRDNPSCRKPTLKYNIKTRASSKCNFFLRKPNTEKYKRCASYLGPKKWNALPAGVQNAGNKIIFKNSTSRLFTGQGW